jgi:hypothetical protein
MKLILSAAALLVLGAGYPAFAHGMGGMGASPMAAGMTYTVPKGTTSGPVSIHNPTTPLPTTTIINNGTVAGGPSAGITVTGPTPTTVINNGAVTSDTTGITVSGSSSSDVVNSGTIVAHSSSTSSATATGVSQGQ